MGQESWRERRISYVLQHTILGGPKDPYRFSSPRDMSQSLAAVQLTIERSARKRLSSLIFGIRRNYR
jgi:hypothetical protein